MIRFSCERCQTGFQIDDSAAGKNTNCPKCGAVIRVPLLDQVALRTAAGRTRTAARPSLWLSPLSIVLTGVAVAGIAIAAMLLVTVRRTPRNAGDQVRSEGEGIREVAATAGVQSASKILDRAEPTPAKPTGDSIATNAPSAPAQSPAASTAPPATVPTAGRSAGPIANPPAGLASKASSRTASVPLTPTTTASRVVPPSSPSSATRSVPTTKNASTGKTGSAPLTSDPAVAEALQHVALIEHPLGSGSGFAVGKNLLVTNAHVVDGVFPDEIRVQFSAENSPFRPITRILHFDRARDLCVIELNYPQAGLPLRSDYELRAGDTVTLMGNPSARGGILLRNAVNRGQLSSVVRIEDQTFYQIEATVNPGWSGGPVIDAEGRVIAVVAMKATDKTVEDIRKTMGRLDQDFRFRTGKMGYGVGITYGIPASALAKVLANPALRDGSRQAEENDKCAAKTIAQRLSLLGWICYLRMQINVPKQIRQEAKSTGPRKPSGKTDLIALIPERDAAKLDAALKGDSIRSMETKFRDRLDERIELVVGSPHITAPVKRDLKNLARKLREGSRYAEHPTGTYLTFSAKVRGYADDFKEGLKRLSEGLKEKY